MDCPNCGERARQGDAFCALCGAALYGERSGRALSANRSEASTVAMAPSMGTWRPVSDEASRHWAMGAHLSALIGGFMGGIPAFIGPLVVLLVRRHDDAFAAAHARASFNFQISVLIYSGTLVVLTFLTFGLGALFTFPALMLLGVLWLLFTLVGILRAANDRLYRYPLAIPFLR